MERGIGSRKSIDNTLFVGNGERGNLIVALRVADLHIATVGNNVLDGAGIVDNIEIESRTVGQGHAEGVVGQVVVHHATAMCAIDVTELVGLQSEVGGLVGFVIDATRDATIDGEVPTMPIYIVVIAGLQGRRDVL